MRAAKTRSRKKKTEKNSTSDYDLGVFLNVPFDRRYHRIFDAILFTVIDCGFIARCALELDNGAQVRLEKIFNIIEECRYAVHDLSRTQLDPVNRLPRFNMPLELGVFLGAKRFGKGRQAGKSCIILDRERYRFQKFISDIAGQDPRAHADDPDVAVGAVRDWLLPISGGQKIPSAKIIRDCYQEYRRELPYLCRTKHWDRTKLTFNERAELIYLWVEATPL